MFEQLTGYYKEKPKIFPVLTWNIETTSGKQFNLTCELEEFPSQFFFALAEGEAGNGLLEGRM
jgi:hypothetical protein